MDALTHRCHATLVVAFAAVEDVDRERSGKRRQRRACGRVCRRDDSHDEEYPDGQRQRALRGHMREHLVALGYRRCARRIKHGEQRTLAGAYAALFEVDVKEGAKHQKQKYHPRLQQDRYYHVFLRVAVVAAREGALHHVLIEASHRHDHEYSGEELFEEVTAIRRIVEEEYAREVVIGHLHGRLGRTQPQLARHEDDAQHHAAYQTRRLQQIRPDDRLHAAATGVEPYQRHHHGGIDRERYTVVVEYQRLQNGADDVSPDRRSQHLGYEEEPCAAAVRPHAETAVEILVQRHHAHAVEQRYEHEGYDQITYDESTYHLHVGEAVGCYRAGHRYERHARYGRSDHSQRRHCPVGSSAAREETRVVCTPRCAHRHHE